MLYRKKIQKRKEHVMKERKALSISAAFILGATVAAPTAIWTWENLNPKEVKIQSSVPTPSPEKTEETKQASSQTEQPIQEEEQANVPNQKTQEDLTTTSQKTEFEAVPERPKTKERVHVFHKPAKTLFGYELEPEKIIATFDSGEKHIYTYKQVKHGNSRCAELASFERRSANPAYPGQSEHAPIKTFMGHRHNQKFNVDDGQYLLSVYDHEIQHPEKNCTPSPVVIQQETPRVIIQKQKPVIIQQETPTVIVQKQRPVILQQEAPPVIVQKQQPVVIQQEVPTVVIQKRAPVIIQRVVRPRPSVRYVHPRIAYVRPRVTYVRPTYHSYVRPSRTYYSYQYTPRRHSVPVRVVRRIQRPVRIVRYHGHHQHDRCVRQYNYVRVR